MPQFKVVTQSNPAAAADFTVTVPAGEYWRIRSAHFTLATDATAATRAVRLTIDDGTTIFYRSFNDVGQSASITSNYSYAPGACQEAAATASSTFRVAPLPDCVVGPTYRISSVTTNKQAGDQFSNISLLVELDSSPNTLTNQ